MITSPPASPRARYVVYTAGGVLAIALIVAALRFAGPAALPLIVLALLCPITMMIMMRKMSKTPRA